MTKALNRVELLAAMEPVAGPLLPMFHEVQWAFGCVSPEAEAEIAAHLNLTRAEVPGVASFYHDFSATPDPRPCVQLCRAEACQARGVEQLIAAAEQAVNKRVRLMSTKSVNRNFLGKEVQA